MKSLKFKSSNITAVNLNITVKPINRTDDFVALKGILAKDISEFYVSFKKIRVFQYFQPEIS